MTAFVVITCGAADGVLLPVWAPHANRDIDILEGVHWKKTKKISQLKHTTYNKKLKEIGLFHSKMTWLRWGEGDLTTVFNYLMGI